MNTHTFVRKHTTSHLPIKYMRLSVQSLLHKNDEPEVDRHEVSGLGGITDFIETPIPKYHK